jgi:hypothetical protein
MSGMGWGAKVESPDDDEVRAWTVVLESEPLGSLAVEAVLARFAADARRLAPDAECSLGLGGFRMRLTVEAAAAEEAADRAENVFARALETALWPQSTLASFTPHDVLVTAAEGTNLRAERTPPPST